MSPMASASLGVAESALHEIGALLSRKLEIVTMADTGTVSEDELSQLRQENQSTTDELDRILQDTNFNGQLLLDGGLGVTLQVGIEEGSTMQIDFDGPGLCRRRLPVRQAGQSGAARSGRASSPSSSPTASMPCAVNPAPG